MTENPNAEELRKQLELVILNEEARRRVITHHLKSPLSSIDSNVKRMLHDLEQKEKEIQTHLRKNINVVATIKMIGSWDFEIELEVRTKEEMLEITRNFRDSFKDLIKEFEVIPLFHEYKYNFFPVDIINKKITPQQLLFS
jgi:predicted phage-related endonuclease